MAPTPPPLAASPYRVPSAPRPGGRASRPPPWRTAALLSALLAGAVSTPKARIGRAAGDLPCAGAPVEHARLLAGGQALCAFTAMRDGTHQVVCAESDEVTEGIERRHVSHAWRSPALVQLAACGGDTVALGLTADGAIVRFARGGAEAIPWAPPPGSYGPVVALSCDDTLSSGLSVFAAMRDGAVLRFDTWNRDPASPPVWVETFPARAGDTHLAPRPGDSPCAVRSDGVWCKPFDTVGERVPAERVLAGTSWVQAAGASNWLCARDRAGRVACARQEQSDDRQRFDWRPAVLEGAPHHGEVVAASMFDLCVRGGADRWWCAAGPSHDEPPLLDAARLAVHPEPLLDGAVEVALGQRGGCARWPDGDVRCWGRHLRGGSFTTRGPVEIPAVRDASAVSVDGAGACAIRRGEVWCWGGRTSARPRRVALPGDAQVLDDRYVAVGATVHRIHDGGYATALPNPRGDDAPVASLAHGWNSVCARRTDGRVTCWHVEEAGDDEGPSTLRDVPERVAALEGYARFATSDDRVCAWDPGRDGRCWGEKVVDPTRVIVRYRWRVQEVRGLQLLQLDTPTQVDGHCAVYPDGRRDCDKGGTVADDLRIAAPDWALDPRGEFAQLHRRNPSRCDLLPDRRVACQMAHVTGSPRAPGVQYPLPFWRVIPGLGDVRAVSATPPFAPRGYGDWLGCAIRQDGRVFCWGSNLNDTLSVGDSDRAPPLVPLRR